MIQKVRFELATKQLGPCRFLNALFGGWSGGSEAEDGPTGTPEMKLMLNNPGLVL